MKTKLICLTLLFLSFSFMEKVNAQNRENDFFVAVFMNPCSCYIDFVRSGMTRNNTMLRPASEYWNIPKVRDFFNNKAEFQTFYNNVRIAYNYFMRDDTRGRRIVQMEFSPQDIHSPSDALFGNCHQRNYIFANHPNRLHRRAR